MSTFRPSLCGLGGWLTLAVFAGQLTAQDRSDQGIKKEFNVRVPMRDGIKLSVDIFRPDGPGKFPVVLSRTPYDNSRKGQVDLGIFLAKHGYAYVTEDSRGRLDSDGEFV